jgi:Esterase-like activity of phytase
MPQTAYGNPPGYLAVIETTGHPSSWTSNSVPLVGLADLYPSDPEPEFVDINTGNQAVVTLQENNHIVIVDLTARSVVSEYSAGTVSLNGIDTEDDFVISLVDSLEDVPREPDAATWVWGDHIATANEGDLNGGSRGFTIFKRDGTVVFDSGNSFERLAVRHGHYPEDRSDDKGTEPEAIEYEKYGPDDLLFVGSERGSFVAVYRLNGDGLPTPLQVLPAPLGPEGLLAIPQRNLLVASGEEDVPSFGVRSTVMIYQLKQGPPVYPQLQSFNNGGSPIPWSALSGMTEIPGVYDQIKAVWDSYYSESRIFTIDVSHTPAVVTDALTITGASGALDPEGIAYAPDGTVWVVSEGDGTDSVPNRLLQINATTGAVVAEVGLPAAVLACRAAEVAKAASSNPPPPNGTGTLGSGFEGVDVADVGGGQYRLHIAQQRGWNYTTSPECNGLDDDPADIDHREPTRTRIWTYDPFAVVADSDDRWSFVSWELQPKPPNATWVGLSEITRVPSGWILIERDNRTGDFGVLKTLVGVTDAAAVDGFTNGEKSIFDLRPNLTATNGWMTDKPEGVAVLDNGETFVVTDNDGVEDWSGETWFFGLGRYWNLFD